MACRSCMGFMVQKGTVLVFRQPFRQYGTSIGLAKTLETFFTCCLQLYITDTPWKLANQYNGQLIKLQVFNQTLFNSGALSTLNNNGLLLPPSSVHQTSGRLER